MPTCEPVQCDQEESTGELRSVVSYGKRRRRAATTSISNELRDDLLLVQSIQITDKFGFERAKNQSNKNAMATETVFMQTESANGICVNMAGMIVAGTVFLAAQLAIIAAWTFIWQRRRMNMKHHQDAMSVSVSMPSSMSVSRTDSLCKLYDAGYGRRF